MTVDVWPHPDLPWDVADKFLSEWATDDGDRTYRSWREGRYVWAGGVWREAETTELTDRVGQRLRTAVYVEKDDKRLLWRPGLRKVTEIIGVLDARSRVDRDVDDGTWLDDPSRGRVIATSNGLLDLHDRQLHPHSPAWWSTTLIPTDYDPAAPPPTRWLEFLRQLWGEDRDSPRLLQQWFGYALSGRTDLHKALLVVGPKRSGKGTIGRILTALIGPRNVVAPTLAGLTGNFGTEPLIGKSLALIGDARLKRDVDVVTERMLSIIGEDSITVDRKNRGAWTGRLPTRFMVLTNELPQFNDASAAITSRFVTLSLENSFFGQENHGLTEELLTELPGILNWALDGLDDLDEIGRLAVPAASAEAMQEMEDSASPMSAFLRDECVLGSEHEVRNDEFLHAYRRWLDSNGYTFPLTDQKIGKDRKSAAPSTGKKKGPPDLHGRRVYVLTGVRLRASYERTGT